MTVSHFTAPVLSSTHALTHTPFSSHPASLIEVSRPAACILWSQYKCDTRYCLRSYEKANALANRGQSRQQALLTSLITSSYTCMPRPQTLPQKVLQDSPATESLPICVLWSNPVSFGPFGFPNSFRPLSRHYTGRYADKQVARDLVCHS